MSVNRQSYFSSATPVAPTNSRRTFGNLEIASSQDAPKKKYKIWINLGMYFGDEFVSPLGLTLDLFDVVEITSQNPETVRRMTAENDIILLLKQMAEGLEEGETTDINLQLQMRRANGKAAELDKADKYVVTADMLGFKKKAAE